MAGEPLTGNVYGAQQARERTRTFLDQEAAKPLRDLLAAVESAHSSFVTCLDGVSREQAAYQPAGEGEEAFSIAQVARHVAGSSLIMAERLLAIGRGETPKRSTSPGYFGDEDSESLPELKQALMQVLSSVQEAVKAIEKDEQTQFTVPHPFFGDLNSRKYLRLMGLHLLDHVHQVGKIKADARYPAA
jgi:hypothetical protein